MREQEAFNEFLDGSGWGDAVLLSYERAMSEKIWNAACEHCEKRISDTAKLLEASMIDVESLKDENKKLWEANERLRKELIHALGFHD